MVRPCLKTEQIINLGKLACTSDLSSGDRERGRPLGLTGQAGKFHWSSSSRSRVWFGQGVMMAPEKRNPKFLFDFYRHTSVPEYLWVK